MHTVGRQSLKNAFEPHLNAEVAQIFPTAAHSLQNGERTTEQSLKKFALNEFLLE